MTFICKSFWKGLWSARARWTSFHSTERDRHRSTLKRGDYSVIIFSFRSLYGFTGNFKRFLISCRVQSAQMFLRVRARARGGFVCLFSQRAVHCFGLVSCVV